MIFSLIISVTVLEGGLKVLKTFEKSSLAPMRKRRRRRWSHRRRLGEEEEMKEMENEDEEEEIVMQEEKIENEGNGVGGVLVTKLSVCSSDCFTGSVS